MNVFRISIAILVMLIVGVTAAVAQHCPYDGGRMILVEVVDSKEQPVKVAAGELTLEEIDNAAPERCAFTSKLISLDFAAPVNTFTNRYRSSVREFNRMCEGCDYLRDNVFAVIIGQSEASCMVKNSDGTGTGYERYVPRKFVAKFKRGMIERSFEIPPRQIHSMCTDAGPWSRFQPVRIQIDAIR